MQQSKARWLPQVLRMSALEDDLGEGQIAAMSDGERDVPHPETVGELARYACQVQRRLPTGRVGHFNVAPAHPMAPPGAQCLHGRFFGGKSRGVTLKSVLVAFTIGDFARRIDAFQKYRSAALDGCANPVDFRYVDSQPYDQYRSLPRREPKARTGLRPDAIIPIIDVAQRNPMATTATEKGKFVPSAAKATRAAASGGWAVRRVGGVGILESDVLVQLPWLVHGISTRRGGGSELPTFRDGRNTAESVLNLGFTDWDSRDRVLENRRKFFHALSADQMRAVTLRQIHSDIVHLVRGPHSKKSKKSGPRRAPQADATITCERNVLLVAQTADCFPLFLADTKRHAVAAVHSGWRGTLRRIAGKALGRMRMEFGTDPEDVIAAIGPGIRQCCFEVGPEVAREFQSQFSEARDWFDGPFDSLAAGENDPNWLPWLTMRPPGHPLPVPKAHLDLVAANRAILLAAGVPKDKIFASDFCTACRTDLFFSYRRERTTGRLMAAIGIL
jgi:purine-nucleoside/S-methyl-5'-thioadenosine phosphorylase / adenosine deaminase